MPVTRFQRIQTNDKEINLLQNRLAETLDSITGNPILDGKLHQQIVLKQGSNLLNHGLGRNYVSFYAGNLSAPARLSAGASPDTSNLINVISDAACSADLYFY